MKLQRFARSDWPFDKVAAAIRADAFKTLIITGLAERALKGADERLIGIGAKVTITSLAIWPHLKHLDCAIINKTHALAMHGNQKARVTI